MKMEQPSRRARVLVVDDRPENVELLEAMLQPEGHQVLIARSGDEALTLAQAERPDLVLLDVAMPQTDGYQVCSQLKASPDTAHIPVILISAVHRESADITRGLEAGADDYVTKPVDRSELLARAQAMLRIKFMHDELAEKQKAMETANERLQRQTAEIDHLKEELQFQDAQLRVKNMLVELELEMAREVHRGLLPRELPQWPGLALAHLYLPSGRVGGDLYQFVPFEEEALGIFMADVAGHGVSAAFIAAMTKMAFNSYASATRSPAELVSHLDSQLSSHLRMGLYVTMFYGIYRRSDRHFTFTRAGHPKPLLFRAGSDTAELLDTEGHVIGAFEEGVFGEGEVVLAAGDRLVLFTDGVNECFNPAGEPYGSQWLREAVRRHHRLPPGELAETIGREITEWMGGERLRDDVALMVVTVEE